MSLLHQRTGHYVNAAADVLAIATPLSQPAVTPSSTPPNIIVDTVNPTLTFADANPSANPYRWNNSKRSPLATRRPTISLEFRASGVPNPLVLSTEGKNVTGQVTVTDYANNSATFSAPTATMQAVNIDKTPPTITPSSTYAPGTWTNQNVTVAVRLH